MAKVSEKTRDAMFVAWQEKQSLDYVRKKCGVAWVTAARYREKDEWDKRLAKIKAKTQAKVDDNAAKRRARHIELAQLMQKKGAAFLRRRGCGSAKTAVSAIAQGVRVEREIVGEGGTADGDAVLVVKLVQSNG
jgi:tRNA A37 N6-isopentenylltransferase MiaA